MDTPAFIWTAPDKLSLSSTYLLDFKIITVKKKHISVSLSLGAHMISVLHQKTKWKIKPDHSLKCLQSKTLELLRNIRRHVEVGVLTRPVRVHVHALCVQSMVQLLSAPSSCKWSRQQLNKYLCTGTLNMFAPRRANSAASVHQQRRICSDLHRTNTCEQSSGLV